MSALGGPQPQTGDTTGTARKPQPTQQPQADWRARAHAAANVPNPLYSSTEDVNGGNVKRTKCCHLRKLLSIRPITGFVFALIITILLPYLAAKVDTLSDEVGKVAARSSINDQRLTKLERCIKGFKMWRGICYKVFTARKSFTDSAAICRQLGGTLAMPRDADTNAFLISLHEAAAFTSRVYVRFGLHDWREEGSFEWMDGTALGNYTSWGPGQPQTGSRRRECVFYDPTKKYKWYSAYCEQRVPFICQVTPAEVEEGLDTSNAEVVEGLDTSKAEVEEGVDTSKAEVEEGVDTSKAEVEIEEGVDTSKAEVEAGVDTSKAEVEAGVDTSKAEVEEGVDTSKAEVEAGVDTSKAEVEEGLDTSKAEVEEGVDTSKAEVEAGVDTSKAEVEEGVDTSKAEVEAGVDTSKAEAEEGLDTSKAEVEEGVDTFKAEVEEGVDTSKAEVEEGESRG
ncbi:PLIN4 [Branchiostoma lanceolatum]|uniref:PLIN4 protein n=1 Tax=Branchiostoma lanceolatum TaxID=7740 RepID=A0A8J9Z0S5_BRALA|nr:PLIN4 [Branchiostoma lanceolatum]